MHWWGNDARDGRHCGELGDSAAVEAGTRGRMNRGGAGAGGGGGGEKN